MLQIQVVVWLQPTLCVVRKSWLVIAVIHENRSLHVRPTKNTKPHDRSTDEMVLEETRISRKKEQKVKYTEELKGTYRAHFSGSYLYFGFLIEHV